MVLGEAAPPSFAELRHRPIPMHRLRKAYLPLVGQWFRYQDRPGVVGTAGRVLGDAGINIANMQVSRAAGGGDVAMVLSVDSSVSDAAVAEIAKAIDASLARAVDLPA